MLDPTTFAPELQALAGNLEEQLVMWLAVNLNDRIPRRGHYISSIVLVFIHTSFWPASLFACHMLYFLLRQL
jgi:hypothetical protein